VTNVVNATVGAGEFSQVSSNPRSDILRPVLWRCSCSQNSVLTLGLRRLTDWDDAASRGRADSGWSDRLGWLLSSL